MKKEATEKAQAVLGGDVIFASNTSTLPIASLAETAEKPENFIGVHFFSPVDKMMLVEVIMGAKTAQRALADGARLRPRDQEDADRRQRLPRLLRQPLRHQLHGRGAQDADGRRAAGDDRERRAHGRHAGRAAGAQRRSRRRPVVEDPPGGEEGPRRAGGRSRSGEADRGDGGQGAALRPQERQGLLRLSRRRGRRRCGRAWPRSPARRSIPTRSTCRS